MCPTHNIPLLSEPDLPVRRRIAPLLSVRDDPYFRSWESIPALMEGGVYLFRGVFGGEGTFRSSKRDSVSRGVG